jgi:hypothetical protein
MQARSPDRGRLREVERFLHAETMTTSDGSQFTPRDVLR